ncbi:TetR/AcrR family transcriptional regulator [Actinacidiphila oryziradicis]|jgi:AcrR family transcriptional regulator|uniref:TetR/AcrR family transcriptional regulator n=1 Tax=Actinacidiphila oryziradicis TaxID=2571141 RepID=A0A4U0SHX1_9ACTN|nr:TetR/AcrR family transcriptional regulator [Actinacidiphila oryziradicis]MCW2868947.1 Transcriptional regulator, TetR family [Actinacidiphila oryziradicis]TKA09146.1 TetR/AcrR family transcriptional regulator [Actinacidiphila oryziradicis]
MTSPRATGNPGSRRSEHVADTRKSLVAAARTLFAERGYAATGTEDIVAAARVTRGALYHHFRDKADLFRAVMGECAQEMAERLVEQETRRAEQHPGDAWQLLRTGFQSFLDACNDPDFQRIVLVEGPAVLGHSAWDTLVEQHGYLLLAEALTEAIQEGRIEELPVPPLTRMLASLISEASLYIARAEDHDRAREEAGAVLDRLLAGLAVGSA